MVRVKLLEARSKLLSFLKSVELTCHRFLDYHGLRLLHGWMEDTPDADLNKDFKFREKLSKKIILLKCLLVRFLVFGCF